MALFKGALSKEGKGVEKGDSEKKHPFVLFFSIYSRKFWNLCQVTLFHSLCGIPAFVLAMVLSGLISGHIVIVLEVHFAAILSNEGSVDTNLLQAYIGIFDILARAVIALGISALWGLGPVTTGYTYILRNYAREEHAWPWADFIEQIRKNFRQSVVVWILDCLVFALTVYAFFFYASAEGTLQVVKYVIAFVALAYTLMHIYIYPLMITYELKLKDVFKNAFLLAVGALPSNVLVAAVTVLINASLVVLGFGVPFLAASSGYWTCYALLAVFVFPGFTGLLKNFVAHRVMRKFLRMKNNEK